MNRFTVWYKVNGDSEVEIIDAILCGLHPDYNVPVYYIRDANGMQVEIPLTSLSYLKFSKERYNESV